MGRHSCTPGSEVNAKSGKDEEWCQRSPQYQCPSSPPHSLKLALLVNQQSRGQVTQTQTCPLEKQLGFLICMVTWACCPWGSFWN